MFLIIISVAIHFAYDYSTDLNLLEKRVTEVRKSAVPALVNSIWLADWEMVRVEAEGVGRLPEIMRVEVTAEGRTIAEFGPEPNAPASPQVFQLTPVLL